MSEEELGRCEEHLLVCDACRREVAASDAYVEAMRKAAAQLRRGKAKPDRK
jgi:anti-sigma factor RsiW